MRLQRTGNIFNVWCDTRLLNISASAFNLLLYLVFVDAKNPVVKSSFFGTSLASVEYAF